MTSRPEDQSSLQAKLVEKDDLIHALTAQLEKTVEQLDRLRRSGADRPGRSLPGSSEASGRQAEVIGRMSSFLEEWTEYQPAERILRMEEGIERLLGALESGRFPAPVQEATVADNGAFWEAAKARMLDESGSGNSPPAIEAIAHLEPAPQPHPAHAYELPNFDALDAVDPPQDLPAEPTAEDLLEAVETRDTYIIYLISRLRIVENRVLPPPEWEMLSQAPDELVERLIVQEAMLQEQLKQAEIAHSLERAALTRERAKLAQVKHHLELQVRKLNITMASAGTQEKPPVDEHESRWRRMFSKS